LIHILQQVNAKQQELTPSCLRGKSGGLSFTDMRSLYTYLKFPDVKYLTKYLIGQELDRLRTRSMLTLHMGAQTPEPEIHNTLRMFCLSVVSF
jgi:hypothetical protein